MTTTTPAIEEFNGVPVAKLRGTIAKLTDNPELAEFRFTARNTWIEGTGTRSTIHEWFGVGGDHLHVQEFAFGADHPTLGHGHGPTPQEYVLHALAACIVAGVATTAANRGVELTSIETVVQGTIDVRGVLGIDGDVRNGYQSIDVEIDIDGDGTAQELEALIQASCKRSAVFDMLANPTLVRVGRKA
ncbi:MAG: OsmC family protein [Acidimicrobiia bacterium]|nr:OsmC family protein [Acidimicrobiia bacterium]